MRIPFSDCPGAHTAHFNDSCRLPHTRPSGHIVLALSKMISMSTAVCIVLFMEIVALGTREQGLLTWLKSKHYNYIQTSWVFSCLEPKRPPLVHLRSGRQPKVLTKGNFNDCQILKTSQDQQLKRTKFFGHVV